MAVGWPVRCMLCSRLVCCSWLLTEPGMPQHLGGSGPALWHILQHRYQKLCKGSCLHT